MNRKQHSLQNLKGAFWCDPAKHPEWSVLPFSAFDKTHPCPDKMLEFRTELDYSGHGKMFLRFTAGCRFRLLLNGKFAEDGPVEVGGDYGKKDAPDWWFYDEKEISSFLHPGKNELVFQTFPAGMTQNDYSLGFGWIWCAIRENDVFQVIPAERWQFRVNPFYRSRTQQNFDVPSFPEWTPDCMEVKVPLQAQRLDLPSLISKSRKDFRLLFPYGKGKNVGMTGKKVKIFSGDAVTFYLEFPEELCGHFQVKWEGNHAVSLRFDFQEEYGIPQGPEEFVMTSGHSGAYRTIRCYAFRYARVTVTPSFFNGENNDLPALLSFEMFERHFPVKRPVAVPHLSPVFRQIDELCIRNVVMCMQRLHWDSPIHQEGSGCTGDYRIESLAEYALFHESRLAKADLIRTALLLRQQGKMFHTSYELCYVFMFLEYVQFTGDTDLLKENYDVLQQIFRRFQSFTGNDGLLSNAENYLFIDWVTDGKYNYHHPPAGRGTGVMTALWYGALQSLVQIAEWLSEKEDQLLYRKEAEKVRNAFNRILWDESCGCYRDGFPNPAKKSKSFWLPEDDGTVTYSSLTSIMALACGLPQENQHPEELLRRVVNQELPLRPTVYYMFYLFQAVIRYGAWEKYGMKLTGQWKVFLKTGLREAWDAGDYSHGWGASPAIFLRMTH